MVLRLFIISHPFLKKIFSQDQAKQDTKKQRNLNHSQRPNETLQRELYSGLIIALIAFYF